MHLDAVGTSGADVSSSGAGNISAPTCNIYDDSTASNALRPHTASGSITAKAIGIVRQFFYQPGTGRITPNPPTRGTSPRVR